MTSDGEQHRGAAIIRWLGLEVEGTRLLPDLLCDEACAGFLG